MNVYDSDRLSTTLENRGWALTDKVEEADLVVLNTCSVREKATEKVFSHLGAIQKIRKKHNKEMKIAVIGCVAKELGKKVRHRAQYVDYVFGPQSWHLLLSAIDSQQTLCDTGNYRLDKFKNLAQVKTKSVSAFISIQEGCDNVCTYCIVPFTREREFSRKFNDIISEVKKVVKNGAKEIVFLGQNVNNYKDSDGKNLADLIRETAKIEQVKRIRYVTSYPTYLTNELIDLFRTEPKIMPFLNLPIQAGSNNVLKKMNRHYTREEYFAVLEKIKKANPKVAISSDIIVGFCDESDEDFEDTLDAIKKCKFIISYSFKYSPRPHTPAFKFKDNVSPKDKSERLKKVQTLLKKIQKEFNEKYIGNSVDVLVEQNPREGFYRGRSPYMQNVEIKSDEKDLIGKMVSVKINDASAFTMYGEID